MAEALWVAKQHGHSIVTMLRVYAASTAGAVEADLDAIRYAMATGAGVARYVCVFRLMVIRVSNPT